MINVVTDHFDSDRDQHLSKRRAASGNAAAMRLVAVSEETADQALGQDVDEEASQELIRRDSHDLLLDACGVVFQRKGDSVLLEGDKTMVGVGDAVNVASLGNAIEFWASSRFSVSCRSGQLAGLNLPRFPFFRHFVDRPPCER
jgi:hypothetical protein